MLVGLPGSGKSTYAESVGANALSSDEIRRLLSDDANNQNIHARVFGVLRELLRHRLELKRPVTYIDATNLTRAERQPYFAIAREYGCSVEAVFFDVPTAECQRRNRTRDRTVPDEVIESMAGRLEPPSIEEGFGRVIVVGMGSELDVAPAVSESAALVEGIRVRWTSSGAGDKTLVLVHGWTASSALWEAQIAELAKRYRVIALDLPGHGESQSPEDGKLSMRLFARAVEAVREQAGIEKIVLVGHSMGAPVILEYARLYPQHAQALVLVDGVVARPENAGVYVGVSKRFAGPEGLKKREDFIRAMLKLASPDLQARVLGVTNAAPESTGVGAMAAMGDPAIWNGPPVDAPVLGLYADQSNLADRETLLRIFPSIEYVEIPGTDHFLMMEKPEEFHRLLTAFVDQLK